MLRARALVAEAIGTFALVFVGTGAMVVDAVSGGGVGHVGISLAFGLIVMAMIYAVGDVSGAHFNPVVTLGFWWAGRFPAARVGPYLKSQFGAALFASVLLRLSFPEAATWGETLPHAGIGAASVFEVVLTSFLVFVILGITTEGRIEGGFRRPGDRGHHHPGFACRGAGLGRLDEPGTLVRPRHRQWRVDELAPLLRSTPARCLDRGSRLPRRARGGLLCAGARDRGLSRGLRHGLRLADIG